LTTKKQSQSVTSFHLRLYSHPLYVVLGLLADELDALQHVGDVIDAPLLHLQHLGGPVQVQHAIGRLGDQAHKLLGEQAQRGVVAGAVPGGLGSWSDKRERDGTYEVRRLRMEEGGRDGM